MNGLASENDLIFQLRGVRYHYHGRHLALDGIDLDVRRGDQIVLLGANGSGKSTLLKLLDGLIAPSGGQFTALGKDIKPVVDGLGAFQFHREVGLVFQDPDVQLFNATVFDDVAFGPLQLAPPDGCDPPGEPGPVRAFGRREEAVGDCLGAFAAPGGHSLRRAHRRAGSPDEMGPDQSDPPTG